MIRSQLIVVILLMIGTELSAAEPLQPTSARPYVWIVDGAGDLKGCSNAFTQTNAAECEPFELTVFPWSHGHRRLLLDQMDHRHAKEKGFLLACKLLEARKAEPGRRIVLVAHSAGCAVALAAGCALPRDTIDRMILLAPSVSSGYDVRPALMSAREGIDVFCSERDRIALGLVMRVVRTVDTMRSSAAAGRHGFQPKPANSFTDEERLRLRHHFWSPELAWTGHNGRHHGMHAPPFIKTYLFPLLVKSESTTIVHQTRGEP